MTADERWEKMSEAYCDLLEETARKIRADMRPAIPPDKAGELKKCLDDVMQHTKTLKTYVVEKPPAPLTGDKFV